MSEDTPPAKPASERPLTAIALERALSLKAAPRQRPTGLRDVPIGGPSGGWFSDRFLGAVQASLTMGNGPAWLALAFAAGLVAYFSLPQEPALWALYPVLGFAGLLAWKSRVSTGLYAGLMAVFVLFGIAYGAQSARWADAPQILRETTGMVAGSVVRAEQGEPSRVRLTLDRLVLEDISAQDTPERVRVTVIAEPGDIAVGDRVELLARLGPPPEPVMPGARNMRRELYFERIGATGFSYGRAHDVQTPADDGFSLRQIRHGIERVRDELAQRFAQVLPGDTGALAAALLVGKREGVSEESYEALRRAGLAHLLAISGMHMAMMTLSAMALINLALAFHPSASASTTAIRWSAFAGLAVASFYLMLSGASTATQRAFIMIVIVLLAIILSRRAVTIRGVAFAAFVVLLIHPESLLGPSFQMSFAATLALVAFYGAFATSSTIWKVRSAMNASMLAPVMKPAGLVTGIALTSLVAGLATAPFAAYHFSMGAPLGLVGNILALPLVSLIIMPAGLLALFLTPFALEALPLAAMGFGIDRVLDVARWVATMDGSRVAIRAISPQALLLLTLAGCLAAFFVGRARWLCLLPLAAILLVGLFQPTPALLIERQGATVAWVAQDDDGRGYLDRSVTRGSRFSVEMWQQRLALDPETAPPVSRWLCDPLGCVQVLLDGRRIIHALDVAALEEDCRLADVLIATMPVPADCSAELVVDGLDLQNHGAIALIEDADADSGFRLWPSFTRRTRPWQSIAP